MFGHFPKKYLALNISDSSLEAVQFEVGKEKIKAWGQLEIPSALVSQGKILKIEALASEIKELLKKTRPLSIQEKNAVCHLPDSQIYFHILRLPRFFNLNQIKREIDNQIDSFFPFTKEEIYWRNRLLRIVGDEQEILVVAAPKEVVDDYLKLFKILGIKLLVLGIASESLARFLIKEYNEKEAVIIVDIGEDTSLIALYDQKGIKNSFHIRIAEQTFTAALAQKLEVSLSQAKQLENNFGFDEKKEDGRIFLILQSISQGLIKEIKKTVDYYKIQTGRAVNKIIISGSGARLPKIDEYLANNLGLNVEKGRGWLDLPKEVDSLTFSLVIGLALFFQEEFWFEGFNFLQLRSEKKTEGLTKSINFFRKFKINFSKKFLLYGLVIIILLIIASALAIFQQSKKVIFQQPVSSLISLPASQNVFYPLSNLNLNGTSTDSMETLTTVSTLTASTSFFVATSTEEREVTPTTTNILVKIAKTPTGWLNVRSGPGTNYLIIKKIYPNEIYPFLSTSSDWVQIHLGNNLSGWIKSIYGLITKE